jgi:Rha family phage regulatory protein
MDQITNLNDFVTLAGDKLVTDSRRVADVFAKQHKNVLRDITKLIDEAQDDNITREFSRLNFEPREYMDERGKEQRCFEMTRDGFALLAMGFTGKEANRWKIRYITAFNAMAEQLQHRELNLWQQMQALIAQEVESKVRASFGSHLMLQRKKEKPVFQSLRQGLEAQIQPCLFLH